MNIYTQFSIKILTSVGCIVFCVSCNLPTLEKPAPATNEVRSGTSFRINLPEEHNTGYTWHLNEDFNHRLLEQTNTVWHGNEKGIDFNFKALSAGQTTLTLTKRKYNDTSAVTLYVVKIFPK